MIKREIDLHADTLRGIAIILVLFVHISAYDNFDGMRDDLNLLVYLFQNVRLPLFTVLSGFFFTKLANRELPAKKFFSKKFKSLLVPFYIVITIEVLLSVILGVGKIKSPIYYNYIFSLNHYWFIQAILIIFSFHFFISQVSGDIKYKLASCAFALMLFFVLSGSKYNTSFFSFSGAIYLYPYFVLGTLMPTISSFVRRHNLIVPLVLLSLGFLILQYLTYDYAGFQESFRKRGVLGMVSGVVLTTCLFCLSFDVKLLAKIGKYSFPIYLYQTFGNKFGAVIVLSIFNLSNWVALVLIIALSIIFSITAEIIIKKSKTWFVERRAEG